MEKWHFSMYEDVTSRQITLVLVLCSEYFCYFFLGHSAAKFSASHMNCMPQRRLTEVTKNPIWTKRLWCQPLAKSNNQNNILFKTVHVLHVTRLSRSNKSPCWCLLTIKMMTMKNNFYWFYFLQDIRREHYDCRRRKNK